MSRSTWETKTRKRTLPLPAQTAAATDPLTAATHPSDRKKLDALGDQGWELFDAQGDEYRLRRRLASAPATAPVTAPVTATPSATSAETAAAETPSDSAPAA